MKQALAVAGLFLLLSAIALAQAGRSYHYASIEANYTVNRDTTVSVKEQETYAFAGEYHLGWRSIPHKALDAITDISVIDEETGQPLTYSSSRLNKDDASSWGKYTVYSDN